MAIPTLLRRCCLSLAPFLLVSLCAALPPAAPDIPWTVDQIFGQPPQGPPAPANTAWSPDGSRFSYEDAEGLMALDARKGSRSLRSLLVPASKLAAVATRPVNEKDQDHRNRYDQPQYFWSPDETRLLFDADGTLWLYTLRDRTMRQVGDSGQGSGDDAKFSPDGAAISYLHAHNLYIVHPDGPGAHAPAELTQTTDPALENGEVDWVYLEELQSRTNYAWSPDSRHIEYVQMDERKVPQYPLVDWIPTHATTDLQRYPQPGDPNPSVRLGVVAATGGETRWIDLPLRAGDDTIPRHGWIDDHTVWAEVLTRDHKHLDIYFADIATGQVNRALAQTDARFFNDDYDVFFYAPGQLLITSWRDGHTHLYRYRYDAAHPLAHEAELAGELEHGAYDVMKVLSIDTAAARVYYASTETAKGPDPRQQQIWSVALDGGAKQLLSSSPGTHKAEFAVGHSTYTDMESSSTTPPRLRLCDVGAECRQLWQQASDPRHPGNLPLMLELKAADGTTTLYASLTLPNHASGAASVPLINNPYGGPGASTVADKWGGNAHSFDELLAEHGFAVLHVDNRGMGARGRDFEQACYRDFGRVQLADQLAAIDQVLARYPQLDPRRLGWWGWSWGGTFTLNALTHSDRFRTGVAVAPVTDFRNYDSIYTERYLGLPADNAQVYDAAAVLLTAARLKARLLLVHGTGDDNVHIANTVQFVQKLIDADLPYDLQIYPRKTHAIAGPEARTHLYKRILQQFETYLKPEPAAR